MEVEFGLTDVLEEWLHAGFRLGDRFSEDMVAVRLASPLKLLIAASPAYLEANRTPKTPDGLSGTSAERCDTYSAKGNADDRQADRIGCRDRQCR